MRAVAGALGTALGFADIILKSLPIANPTERIEEFKSIVEKGAEAVAYVIGPERDRPSQPAE